MTVERGIYELRSSQLDDHAPSGGTTSQTGWVGYTHGPGIDAPLDLIRRNSTLVIPHANYRGHYAMGTTATGAEYTVDIDWPAGTMDPFLGADMREYKPWYGSLIQGKRDVTGLMYMRNRYYDPATGQFTQEDPIGLAGGLNLYGYANGDPINFSDPFGLCPPGSVWCNWMEAGFTALGSLVGFVAGGGGGTLVAVATGGVGIPAAPAGAWSGAAAGGAVGLAVGQAITNTLFSEDQGRSGSDTPESPQDRRLSAGEIKKLKDAGYDIHDLKGGKGASRLDLFKDRNGNISVKPKNGRGPGDPTGININDIGN